MLQNNQDQQNPGLFQRGIEAVSGVARGFGEFAKENPEILGLTSGLFLGGRIGQAGLFGAGGLLKGARQRERREVAEIQQQQKLASLADERRTKLENQLRTNFKSDLREFKDRGTSIKGIEDALSRGTGAGDVAAITSYQKLIDPSGRVSDEDFQNAMKTAGLLNESATKIKGIWTGVKLDGRARKGMLEAAVGQFKAAESVFDDTIKNAEGTSERLGIDVRNIIQKPRIEFDIQKTIRNNPNSFTSTLKRRAPKVRTIKL